MAELHMDENSPIGPLLQTIAATGASTLDELKRLRDLRHKDGNSLQNYAVNQQALKDQLEVQGENLKEFRKETREGVAELKKESTEVKTILNGPIGKPTEGIVFKVGEHEKLVKSIYRLIWAIIGATVIAVAAVVVGSVSISWRAH